MFRADFLQATVDRAAKIGEGGVVPSVKHSLLNETPQPFDQIQVRRIRRQEHQLDVQLLCQFLHQGTMLITRVVQDDGDRSHQAQGSDLPQQLTHRFPVHHRVRGRAHQGIGDRVPCAQHAVAFPPRRAANHQTNQTPHATQKRTHDEVGRVREKHVGFPRPSRGEYGLKLVLQKLRLRLRVFRDRFLRRQGNGPDATPTQTDFFLEKLAPAMACVPNP